MAYDGRSDRSARAAAVGRGATALAGAASAGNLSLGVLAVLAWDGGDLFERLGPVVDAVAATGVLTNADAGTLLVPTVVGTAIAATTLVGVAGLVGTVAEHRTGRSPATVALVASNFVTVAFFPLVVVWALLAAVAWVLSR